MDDLATYYGRLATWEGKAATTLIAAWDPEHVDQISGDFRLAFQERGFDCLPLPIVAGTTNQSIGNKVADFLAANIVSHLRQFRIEPCQGAGYPDKRLLRVTDRRAFAFELKATSQFDRNDSNRIVLTSSSEKLRRCFEPPINHLLATACYELDRNHTEICIKRLRLDFLEPKTPVNVRLEASVSQRILAHGTHRNICF